MQPGARLRRDVEKASRAGRAFAAYLLEGLIRE
jgi:hypothetical protein